jgi:hypothetical protein
MSFWKTNRQNKNGSWTLSSDYLKYKAEGGVLSAEGWNSALRGIKRDLGLTVEAKDTSKGVEQ